MDSVTMHAFAGGIVVGMNLAWLYLVIRSAFAERRNRNG